MSEDSSRPQNPDYMEGLDAWDRQVLSAGGTFEAHMGGYYFAVQNGRILGRWSREDAPCSFRSYPTGSVVEWENGRKIAFPINGPPVDSRAQESQSNPDAESSAAAADLPGDESADHQEQDSSDDEDDADAAEQVPSERFNSTPGRGDADASGSSSDESDDGPKHRWAPIIGPINRVASSGVTADLAAGLLQGSGGSGASQNQTTLASHYQPPQVESVADSEDGDGISTPSEESSSSEDEAQSDDQGADQVPAAPHTPASVPGPQGESQGGGFSAPGSVVSSGMRLSGGQIVARGTFSPEALRIISGHRTDPPRVTYGADGCPEYSWGGPSPSSQNPQ